MQKQEILPVLYDLSVTIGGETRLKPLLTRTLQRLLYHTSYAAGFICLEVPDHACDSMHPVAVSIEAAVGDFDLISRVGQITEIPNTLLRGCAVCDSVPAAQSLAWLAGRYHVFLRLPLPGGGVVVLLAKVAPETHVDLAQVMRPMLAQLSKAIVLCRAHDAYEDAAAQRQQQQRQMLDEAQHLGRLGHWQLDLVSNELQWSDEIYRIFEIDPRQFGASYEAFLDTVHPQDRAAVAATYEQSVRQRSGYTIEHRLLFADGRIKWVSERGYTDYAEDGTPLRSIGTVQDITERKEAEEHLHNVNLMLNLVLETVPLRVFWKDTQLRYLGCNSAFARDAGLTSPQQLIGKDDTQMGWHEQAALYQADDRRVLEGGQPRLNFEEPQTTSDGHQIWLRTSKVPLRDDGGQTLGVLGIYDDITEQKEAEARIHELAYFDSLTKLPNRQLLQERLHQAMASSAHTRRRAALIMLDLDDFKNLNDSKGHELGDRLLIEVARRLIDGARDFDTVARFGGDEFAVLLENLSPVAQEAAQQAERTAEKLRVAMEEPFRIDELAIRVTASFGITLILDHQESLNALLQHGESAMYLAKQAGRNTVRFFDPAMQAEFEARLTLIEDLAQAQAGQQLRIYFQPQVTATGLATGAEVLLRWQHPTRGLVSPVQFIPLAEETGQIVSMGMWVLQAACQQLKRWQGTALLRELLLSVNVSVKQFGQPDFVDQVRRVLLDTGAKPSHLKLELTESTVLGDVEGTIAKMQALKLLGISFSMDDFGTGYSSLQYLKRLPLDQIKIDQSFVRDVTSDANGAAIVQTIIAMSEALGLNVIAEGVETQAQKDFLDARGCHAFQGYLFGRPVPLQDFEKRLIDTHGQLG